MSKKKSKSNPTRFQKCKNSISNIRQRFPKWKFFACGIILIIGIIIGLTVAFWPSNAATTARNGDTVKVAYIGTYDNSSVFDSANSSAPWQFTIGNKSAISGFEKGVIGMSVNETKKIRVKPEDGYGPAELKVNINEFPEGVAVGQYYSHTLDNGVNIQSARVTAINGSTVTLQNLTPMAGLYLNFEITLVDLIKAGQASTNTSN
jgi:FKBP-type peptidyl-prolyl cis-trans isomerase 2